MSEFKPMTECKGFNMERVLLKNKNGYMITAYFKDGMLQCDGDEDWTQPISWDSFIRLKDLANGVPASDSGLHLQRVSKRCSHCLYRKYRPNAKHRYELNQCQISGHNLTDVENHSCEHYKPIPNAC